MNICCAYRIIKTSVAAMKAASPLTADLPDEQFMFTSGELYEAMRGQGHSIAEIVDLVDTLIPELEGGNPCTCGTTDPTVCGVAFCAIIDEMFDAPTTQ